MSCHATCKELSNSNFLFHILDEIATDSSSNAGIVEIYQRTGPNTFIRFQTLTPPGELGSSPRKFLPL